MPKVRNSPVWCLMPVRTVVVCPPVCSSFLQFYHINAYVYRKSMLSLSDSCSLERSPRLHLRRLKWLNFTFSVCVWVVLLTSGEWFLQLTRDWCDLLSVLNSTRDRCPCLGLTGGHVCFACFYLLILWVIEWEAQPIYGDVLRSSPIRFEWCLHNIYKMEKGTQTEE